MSVELDAAFRSQRTRITQTAAAAAARAWARPRDRRQAVPEVVRLVEASQAATVVLVDAYMAAKARDAGAATGVHGLDRGRYTTAALRGIAAETVYERPLGALGAALEAGASYVQALASSQASLNRLVRTDLQLAHTHAARDWMADEPRVAGYRRVLGGGGTHCGLCVAASTQRYHKADLLPIHERCGCSVSPIFGDAEVARTIDPDTWRIVKAQAEGDLSPQSLSRLRFDPDELPDVVRVRRDPELGLRLADERWAA